jgi:hypothetical protein
MRNDFFWYLYLIINAILMKETSQINCLILRMLSFIWQFIEGWLFAYELYHFPYDYLSIYWNSKWMQGVQLF